MTSKDDLDSLESHLGYQFSRRELLERALTHASLRNGDSVLDATQTYERLEFLGDRVLGLVIADKLIMQYSDAPEGELSRRLARLVSGETCAKVAIDMDLDRYMRIGGGLKGPNKRAISSLRADMCESVLGAVYLDGGLEPARSIIERFWGDRLSNMEGPLRDAKTELQEWAHKNGLESPHYREIERSGPDHAPVFQIQVAIGDTMIARATGNSKRAAAQEAAMILLREQGLRDD